MRKILFGSAILAVVASPAGASFKDDLELHATFVGQKRYDHQSRFVQNIPEGTVVYFDQGHPADRQLIVRPKGRLMEYICPAVPGVHGLERLRPMGLSPEYLTQGDATKIEVIRAFYDNQDIYPLPGLYHSLGIIEKNSVIENGNRVKTLRMLCRSGQDDGMLLQIEYKETYPEFVNVWDISKGANNYLSIIADNPQGKDLPACFTFSCWYKSTGTTPSLDPKALLELRIKASEAHLQGKVKKLRLCVSNVANQNKLYVDLEGSKQTERTKDVLISTKNVLKSEAVPEKFTMESVPTGKYQLQFVTLTEGQKMYYWNTHNHGKVIINNYEVVLVGGRREGSFHNNVPIYRQEKKVTQKAVAAVYEKKSVYEKQTVYDLSEVALAKNWVAKEGWMNFVMHVDSAKKLATVFCNGTQILYSETNFEYSLNTPFNWTIGDKHAAHMNEVNIIQGQLVPASKFFARNSQNELVPLKYNCALGPNGYQWFYIPY